MWKTRLSADLFSFIEYFYCEYILDSVLQIRNNAGRTIRLASTATRRKHRRPDRRSWMVLGLFSCRPRLARLLLRQTARHQARQARGCPVGAALHTRPSHSL